MLNFLKLSKTSFPEALFEELKITIRQWQSQS
jgi:hypothetical protein